MLSTADGRADRSGRTESCSGPRIASKHGAAAVAAAFGPSPLVRRSTWRISTANLCIGHSTLGTSTMRCRVTSGRCVADKTNEPCFVGSPRPVVMRQMCVLLFDRWSYRCICMSMRRRLRGAWSATCAHPRLSNHHRRYNVSRQCSSVSNIEHSFACRSLAPEVQCKPSAHMLIVAANFISAGKSGPMLVESQQNSKYPRTGAASGDPATTASVHGGTCAASSCPCGGGAAAGACEAAPARRGSACATAAAAARQAGEPSDHCLGGCGKAPAMPSDQHSGAPSARNFWFIFPA